MPGTRFDHGVGGLRRPANADHTLPYVEPCGTRRGLSNALRIYPTLGIAILRMSKHLHVALRRLLQFCRAGLEPRSAIWADPREGEEIR